MRKKTFDQKLEKLRAQSPKMFDDKDIRINFDDFYVLDIESMANLDEFWEWLGVAMDQSRIENITEEEFEAFSGHPGGLGRERSIDTLAFYLPFHIYPTKWGVYVYAHGIDAVKKALQPFFSAEKISRSKQYDMSKRLLEEHEIFHHKTEIFVTRLETILRTPCYLDAIVPRYKQIVLTKECYEETCANSYAREILVEKSKLKTSQKAPLRKQINDFFKTMPPGYREAAGTTDSSWRSRERILLFDDYYNESAGKLNLPSTNNKFDWSITGNWDRPSRDSLAARKFILIRKNSLLGKLIPPGLCELKIGNFKRKLKKEGASLFRHGAKHDIWSLDGKITSIPRHDHADIGKGLKKKIETDLGILRPI